MNKKLPILLIVFLISCVIFPYTAQADVGPKPSLTVIAKNMPDSKCYLDLLIDEPLRDVFQNLQEPEKYDQQLLNRLKEYKVKGWRPAMVTGTIPPTYGDIVCKVTNGQSVLHFGYTGLPDRFKIIVVSADGKTVVSNVVKRVAFKSTVYFDYQTGQATESSPLGAYLRQFALTCSATLLIEGLVLLVFGFSWRQNWKPFLAINLFTQVLLTLVVFTNMYKHGTLFAIMSYVPFELVIVTIEMILFTKFLRQHSKLRRGSFAVVANLVSFGFGILFMLKF